MDPVLDEYMCKTFEKIKLIRRTARGEVWLAAAANGDIVIYKRIEMLGLPYKELMKHPHPLYPEVMYCTEDNGETIVIEEFVQGKALTARIIEKDWMTEKEARSVLLQLCDGLASLHSHGIIHRDIKPSNLLLQSDGRIRLVDFDAARTVKEDSQSDTMILGTKGYAPPEQYGYGQTDGRSDIYAVGVTIRELLGNGYNGYLVDILNKCTEIDAKQRYASVKELRDAVIYGEYWHRWKWIGCFLVAALAIWLVIVGKPRVMQEDQPSSSVAENVPEKPAVEEAQGKPKDEEPKPETDVKGSLPPDEKIEAADKAEKPEREQPLPSAEISESKVAYIPPAPKNQEKTIDDAPQKNEGAANVIYVATFLNGRRAAAWADDTNVSNWVEYCSIPTSTWKSWQRGGKEAVFPDDWMVRLYIVNRSKTAWENVRVNISYDDQGDKKTDEIAEGTMEPGEEKEVLIPLSSYSIADPSQATPSRDLRIRISGDGPQEIHGRNAIIAFHPMEPGE